MTFVFEVFVPYSKEPGDFYTDLQPLEVDSVDSTAEVGYCYIVSELEEEIHLISVSVIY